MAQPDWDEYRRPHCLPGSEPCIARGSSTRGIIGCGIDGHFGCDRRIVSCLTVKVWTVLSCGLVVFLAFNYEIDVSRSESA